MLILASFACLPRPAQATTIHRVDFTNAVVIDVPPLIWQR